MTGEAQIDTGPPQWTTLRVDGLLRSLKTEHVEEFLATIGDRKVTFDLAEPTPTEVPETHFSHDRIARGAFADLHRQARHVRAESIT